MTPLPSHLSEEYHMLSDAKIKSHVELGDEPSQQQTDTTTYLSALLTTHTFMLELLKFKLHSFLFALLCI